MKIETDIKLNEQTIIFFAQSILIVAATIVLLVKLSKS